MTCDVGEVTERLENELCSSGLVGRPEEKRALGRPEVQMEG